MVLIRILVLSVLVSDSHFLERKRQTFMKYEQMCNNVTSEPFFEEEKVVGTIWRIYYAWNMIMEDRCMDITFKKATESAILRFRKIMHEYLDTKPNWSKAKLVMTMNVSREMLLIPDDDFSNINRFLGVPNIRKGDYLGGLRGQVPVFKMALNLLDKGRYLLIADCQNGVTSFVVRRDQRHTWGEIATVVRNLNPKFGGDKGYPACKFNKRRKNRRQKSRV